MAASETRFPAVTVVSLLALISNLLLLCATGATIVGTSAKFEGVFADMGMALPALTVWLLQVPDEAYLTAIGAIFVALLVKEVAIRRPAIRLVINLVFFLLCLVLAGVYFLGLFLPMMQAIKSLQ